MGETVLMSVPIKSFINFACLVNILKMSSYIYIYGNVTLESIKTVARFTSLDVHSKMFKVVLKEPEIWLISKSLIAITWKAARQMLEQWLLTY